MKQTMAVLLTFGLVGGALAAGPAEAKKKKKKKPKRVERVVEHSYAAPSPGVPGVAGACLAAFTGDSGCIDIPVTLDDKFVMVDVTDASGQTPAAILAQDTNSNQPGFEIFHDFCGKTEEPVAITPGLTLRVSVYAGPSSSCAGIGTTGDMKVTLSNLP